MYNKTIIRFGSADSTYLDLAYSEYHGKNFIQWLLSVTPLASGLETSVHNDVARDPVFAALLRLSSFSTKAVFSRTTLRPAFHTGNFVLDYITDWTL